MLLGGVQSGPRPRGSCVYLSIAVTRCPRSPTAEQTRGPCNAVYQRTASEPHVWKQPTQSPLPKPCFGCMEEYHTAVNGREKVPG